MYNPKIKKRKPELYKFKGCEGCQRNCLRNGLIAIQRVAERNKEKFPCNLNIAKVWVDKTLKEDK